MAKLSGGAGFQAALKDIGKKLGQGGTLRVGFLENSTYPDKNHTSVPMVAAIQEFGAPSVGIPPRPFFRTMIKRESPGWPSLIGDALKASDYNVSIALEQVGAVIAGQLTQSIFDLYEPPLSPVTIMLRGMQYNNPSLRGNVTRKTVAEARARVAAGKTNYGAPTKPLVWTGHVANSVRYDVQTGATTQQSGSLT